MSKRILVCMYDSKADNWTNPTPFDSKASAIRGFEDLVNDRQPTMVASHPEDFTLFMVGEFDGPVVTGCDKLALANGVDVKRQEVN